MFKPPAELRMYLSRFVSRPEKHPDNLLPADGADQFPHGAVDKEEHGKPHLNQPEMGPDGLSRKCRFASIMLRVSKRAERYAPGIGEEARPENR